MTLSPPFDSLDPDPVRPFRRWLDDAKQVGIAQPYALTLATTSGDNIPSARIALLREVEEDGFISYANYDSLKGQNLDQLAESQKSDTVKTVRVLTQNQRPDVGDFIGCDHRKGW